MKKKVLGLALAAISLVAFNSMAQDSNTATTCSKQGTTQCSGKKDRAGKDGKKGKRQAPNPFEGMTLTEAQQTQLQQLDAKRTAARAEQAKARRADKQRVDSAGMAERRAAKKEYLEEVKAIVGPEQYVVFLENVVLNGPQGPQGKAMTQGRGSQGGKAQALRSNKGGKGAKALRDAKHASNRVAKGSKAAKASASQAAQAVQANS